MLVHFDRLPLLVDGGLVGVDLLRDVRNDLGNPECRIRGGRLWIKEKREL